MAESSQVGQPIVAGDHDAESSVGRDSPGIGQHISHRSGCVGEQRGLPDAVLVAQQLLVEESQIPSPGEASTTWHSDLAGGGAVEPQDRLVVHFGSG